MTPSFLFVILNAEKNPLQTKRTDKFLSALGITKTSFNRLD